MSATTQPANSAPPEISLALPCYNEEACLRQTAGELLDAFARAGIRLELVLVDNGSRDRTGAIIDEMAASGRPVVRVTVPVNQGYGHGVLEGLRRSTAPVLGFLCADGQVSAEDTLRLCRLMLGGDPRFLLKVRRRFRQDGLVRKVVSIFYNLMMRVFFGRLEALDLNGNPKLFSREAYQRMQLESKDWFLDPEVMIKAKHLRLTVVEVNVWGRPRQGGKSKVRAGTVLQFLKNIARYRFTGKLRYWKESLALPAGQSVAAQSAPDSGSTVARAAEAAPTKAEPR